MASRLVSQAWAVMANDINGVMSASKHQRQHMHGAAKKSSAKAVSSALKSISSIKQTA